MASSRHNIFTVRPFEARTLSWWSNERESIDFSPPYQRRGKIWSSHDRSFLIDSVLNGYDIPKFYLADFSYQESSLNKARRPYAVIDGRQRFEALLGFFDDEVQLADSFFLHDQPEIKLGGLTYSELKRLHPRLASKFENFNLSVMTVITDDEARINDLFVRLNSSKPLSGAEIRNAMTGVVTDSVREICAHDFFTKKISFNTTRRQDQNAASKLLLLEYRGALVDTKRANLDRFVKESQDAQSSEIAVVSAGDRVLTILSAIEPFLNEKDPALKLATGIPVFYWLIRNNPVGSTLVEGVRRFEEARRQNKRLAAKGVKSDDFLQQYDYFNRSPDDATSHERRYQIMLKWLLENAFMI